MMVHRVGATLLLDDFDIHKHLLRKQEDDWQWLRKFYFETIVQQMQHDMKVMFSLEFGPNGKIFIRIRKPVFLSVNQLIGFSLNHQM